MASISDFYVLGGTLPRDARSYTARKADQDLLEGLRKGQFCYVLTSRQMGKSSLMVRTVTRLRQESVTCLVIDLTATGQNLSEDQWYDGLLNCVATDLGLEDELDDFWQDNKRLGPLQRWMHALRSVVLTHISGPVVIFVDEVDAVRSLPFSADEFFAGVRECYNRRTEDPEFKRLTFCLLGVATPADLIRDTRSTPFNIGQRIALTDFTEAEAAPLAEGLAAHREGETGGGREGEKMLLSGVLYWTHGHPYLTQRLCSAISEARVDSSSGVDRVCNDTFLSPGAQATDDNLLFVRERLLRADCDPTSLLLLYDKVRSGKRVPNSETDYQISVLRLSGVVRVENGILCVRNRIYSHVFDRNWIRRSMPDEDLKRQKIAFRKGALGTALAGAAIVLLLTSGFMLTHYQKHLNLHVPLPDGTELVVNDVSFGKKAVYTPGAFRPIANLGLNSLNATFAEPTLSLWVSHYNPRTRTTDALKYNPVIFAIDEHGDQFVPTGEGNDLDAGVTRFDFANVPKRSSTIHFQLYTMKSVSGIEEFKKEFVIHNPAPSLYPLWTPEPLPSTKTVGDLAVSLNSVKWLQNGNMSALNSGAQMQNHQLWPEYSCRERAQKAWLTHNPWQIVSMELSDATGNRGNALSTAGNLCIYEPAFQLLLRLARNPSANFTPAETWTMKDAKVPADGSVNMLTANGNINGVVIRPVSIAAAPSVTYLQGSPPTLRGTLGKSWGKNLSKTFGGSMSSGRQVEEVSGTEPQVAVRVGGLRDNQKLTMWATDSNGQRYSQESEEGMTPVNTGDDTPWLFFFLPIPPSVHHLDLHFSVQNIKTVEFMVRPPLPDTESHSK